MDTYIFDNYERFLVFSDIHIHPYKSFSYLVDGGLNSRALLGLKAFNKILDVARETKSAVLFLGDLFEDRKTLHTRYAKMVKELIDDYRDVLIVAIPGNHDFYGMDWCDNDLALFSSPNFLVIEKPTKFVSMYGTFCLHPYPITGYSDFLKELDCFRRDSLEPRYLFTHIDTDVEKAGIDDHEIKTGATTIKDFEGFSKVISGHYHWRQTFKNFTYIGNPIQKDFGDEGQEKGYHIFYPRDGRLEFYPLDGFPHFARFTIESPDQWQFVKDYRKSHPDDYLRLTVKNGLDVPHDFDIETNPVPEIRIDNVKLLGANSRLPEDIDFEDPVGLWIAYRRGIGIEINEQTESLLRFIYNKSMEV